MHFAEFVGPLLRYYRTSLVVKMIIVILFSVICPALRGFHSLEENPFFVSVYKAVLRSNCALSATTIVLTDISNAPTAGERRMPQPTNTPAASGIAMML